MEWNRSLSIFLSTCAPIFFRFPELMYKISHFEGAVKTRFVYVMNISGGQKEHSWKTYASVVEKKIHSLRGLCVYCISLFPASIFSTFSIFSIFSILSILSILAVYYRPPLFCPRIFLLVTPHNFTKLILKLFSHAYN